MERYCGKETRCEYRYIARWWFHTFSLTHWTGCVLNAAERNADRWRGARQGRPAWNHGATALLVIRSSGSAFSLEISPNGKRYRDKRRTTTNHKGRHLNESGQITRDSAVKHHGQWHGNRRDNQTEAYAHLGLRERQEKIYWVRVLAVDIEPWIHQRWDKQSVGGNNRSEAPDFGWARHLTPNDTSERPRRPRAQALSEAARKSGHAKIETPGGGSLDSMVGDSLERSY
jgi:hypothetical protein